MAKLKDDHIRWILSLDAKGVQSELVKVSSASQKLTDDNKKLENQITSAEGAIKKLRDEHKQLTKSYNDEKISAKALMESRTRLNTAIAEHEKNIKTHNLQINDNSKIIAENNAKIDEAVRAMKIEDMTMGQLKKRAKELEIQLNSTSKASSPEAYKSLNDELKSVRERMGEVKGGAKNAEEEFSFFSKESAKGAAIVVAGVMAIKKGFEAYENVMMSTKGTGLEFKSVMDGLNNTWDYMKTALATMDFSNFLENMFEAYSIGHELTLMMEKLSRKKDSFSLTSLPLRAEIEKLKTELRDVNLTNDQRIAKGLEIKEKINDLANQERKLLSDQVDLTYIKLRQEAKLSEDEAEFYIKRYNENEKQIQFAEELIKKEKEYQEARKPIVIDPMIGLTISDPREKGLQEEVRRMKASEEFSQIAYDSAQKYAKATDETVKNYVQSNKELMEVDIRTTQSLRMTQRTIDTLTKKNTDKALGGSTPEQRQREVLNKINKDLEIKHQNEIAIIKQEYKDRDFKNEAKHYREIAVADGAAYGTRRLSLENFLEENKNLEPKVRQDVQKQLAEIDNKILDQEITLRKNIEKILLDADPVAKENLQYEQRLSALELFGVEKEKMTSEQLEALEILEQQHRENLEKIQQAADTRKKAQSEKEFEESFSARREELQLELNDLMQIQAATGRLGFEAEMEVHMKRLQMLHEEVQARKDAGLEIENHTRQLGRVEAQMTNTIKKENDKRTADYNKYATSIATATEGFFSGQQSGLESFGGAMIDIMFDILSQIINQKIIEATAVAVAEQAKAAAIAAAMPDSVFTFGASAAARTAAIGAIIMGALQVAKGALKGMIGKKKGGSSNSSGSKSQTTGQITVRKKGYADGGYNDAGLTGGYTGNGGRYDLAGMFANGNNYHRGEYIIAQPELAQPEVVSLVRRAESIRRQRTNSSNYSAPPK